MKVNPIELVVIFVAGGVVGMLFGQHGRITQEECDYQCSISLEAQAKLYIKTVEDMYREKGYDLYNVPPPEPAPLSEGAMLPKIMI